MEPGVQIRRLFRQWKTFALLEHLLWAAALTMPVMVLLYYGVSLGTPVLWLLGFGFFAGAVLALTVRAGWFLVTPLDLAHYFNRTCPELEESADLLLHPVQDLPPLARLQYQRTAGKWAGISKRLPHHLPRAGIAVAGSLLVSWALWQALPGITIAENRLRAPAGEYLAQAGDSTAATPPPALSSISVTVRPPAYTRLKAFEQRSPEVEAPIGSNIRWVLAFDPSIAEGRLSIGDGRAFPLRQLSNGSYEANYQLDQPAFYTLNFRAVMGNWIASDFYPLKTIPDNPPTIEVEGLPQYAEYPYDPGKTIRFTTILADDYGVSGARLIATVSSGEGESVKFRDDTLRFEASFHQENRNYQLAKTIRLGDLGMAPGDELYLHLEALDNRRPEAQVTKTFKYIIAFENPETLTMDMSGGLAVNRLPEYFRSQRQIIIDTERLIAREQTLEKQVFQQESNNIAIDQKLLRLRYGRFLGEEFQTVIGEVPVDEHGEEESDHEDHEDHDHPTQASEDGEVAELEPYYHTHDITEEVTFFDAITAAKLRTALAEMWSAELHLRMGRPRQALPYEYKALKLIKEIQQASRIYVERVGFEPPAINVTEKRLTGELDAVANPSVRRQVADAYPFPAIEAAAPLLEALRRQRRRPNAGEYRRLQAAGQELAALALEQPAGRYLAALQQLRVVMENAGQPSQRDQQLEELQRVFWSLLADRQQRPLQAQAPPGKLQELFFREIQQSQ